MAIRLNLLNRLKVKEYEKWLEDLSTSGFHLNRVGIIFCSFDQSTPKDYRYSLNNYLGDRKIFEERRAEYISLGWEKVYESSSLDVFRTTNDNISSVDLDPTEENYVRKSMSSFMMLLVVVLFFDVMCLFIMNYKGNTISALGPFVFWIFCFHYLLNFQLLNMFDVRLMFESRNRKDKASTKDWKRAMKVNGSIALALLLFFGVIGLIPIISKQTETLPYNSPYISLADIENSSEMIRREGEIVDGVDQNNFITTSIDILAPFQVVTLERGIFPESSDIPGDKYAPRLYMNIFKVTFNFMIPKMIKTISWQPSMLEEYSYAGVDELYARIIESDRSKSYPEDEKSWEIFAVKDNYLVYISYGGRAELNYIFAQIVNMLDNIESS